MKRLKTNKKIIKFKFLKERPGVSPGSQQHRESSEQQQPRAARVGRHPDGGGGGIAPHSSRHEERRGGAPWAMMSAAPGIRRCDEPGASLLNNNNSQVCWWWAGLGWAGGPRVQALCLISISRPRAPRVFVRRFKETAPCWIWPCDSKRFSDNTS